MIPEKNLTKTRGKAKRCQYANEPARGTPRGHERNKKRSGGKSRSKGRSECDPLREKGPPNKGEKKETITTKRPVGRLASNVW